MHNTQAYYIQRKIENTKNHKLIQADESSKIDVENLKNIINSLIIKQSQLENEISNLKSLINNKIEFDMDDNYVFIKKRGDENEFSNIKIEWGNVL
jgi:uncharacterized phage protein gp47/JayE